MRTYSQALDYLNGFINYERRRPPAYSAETLNLDRMRNLLSRLGEPQQAHPTLHIAGTKGKGSTSAMIESIYRAAGYRTGLYTSPHLHTFRERMRVSGEMISRTDFAARVDEIEPHIAAVPDITWFEILTALAFLHFARAGVEVGVIEVGLGGRFDATNVITPCVSVITSLSLDHQAWLGDTLEQIAFEKAGIIKPGVPVVSAPQPPQALAVVERIAAERDAPLTVVGRDVTFERRAASVEGQEFRLHANPGAAVMQSHEAARHPHALSAATRPGRGRRDDALPNRDAIFKIPLLGTHQIVNAAAAVTATVAAAARGLPVGIEAIREGLKQVEWPGRFEIARRHPPLVFDGAHNADSAAKLAAALDEVFPGLSWTLVFGASADKDIAAMLCALAPRARRLIVTRARNIRAADLEQVAQMATDRHLVVEVAGSVAQALDRALDDGAPLVVTGSIFVVAEAREAWFERIGQPITDRD